METDKERYKKFCEENPKVPLFSRWWWMEAVTEGKWDVLLYENEHEILGSMVYYHTIREDENVITKATLTQNNGIFIKPVHEIKYASKMTYDEKVSNGIIDQLETLDVGLYEQYYHYSFTNWLPFFWRDYQQMTRYTYVIEDTCDLEKVKANFTTSLRRKLKKAKKNVTIKEGMSIAEYYTFIEQVFERQGKQTPYTLEFLERLDKACQKHDACKLYYAIDDEGIIHGGAYFVWDDEAVYYLIGAADPIKRKSQAQFGLIYEGIKLAHKMDKKFDFEGSVLPQIEPVFRSFGGIQKPYFKIWKRFRAK